MSDELEQIRVRLSAAMSYEGDDWLERAEYQLRAYYLWSHRAKTYDCSTVGARIQTAREVLGVSRDQLALRLSVSMWTVRQWERGKGDIPVAKLPGLCMSLRVTRGWLLGESEEGGPAIPHEIVRRPIDPKLHKLRQQQKSWAKGQAKAAEMRAKYGRDSGINATIATNGPTEATGGGDVSDGIRRGEGRAGEVDARAEHGGVPTGARP